MTGLNEPFSIFAAVFGVIGFSGGAVGYFAKGRGDSIIKYQAIEIQNRNDTITTLKEENAALKEQANAKDETIKQLKEHTAYLQKMAQGSPQLKKLTEAIQKQTDVISQVLGKVKSK